MQREYIEEIAKKHFPKPTPNPGQMEAIVDAAIAILNGKKHVIISAPTGSGKSVIATTVHRILAEIKSGWRSTIITSTRGLQDQYCKDDAELYDLKGKTNYRCLFNAGHYQSGGCRALLASAKCDRGRCPYVRRRAHWCNKADIRITNSAFEVSAPVELIATSDSRSNLLVVDECHEIDDIIIENATITLDAKEIESLQILKLTRPIVAIFDFIDFFAQTQIGTSFAIRSEMLDLLHTLSDSITETIQVLESYISDAKRQDLEMIGDLTETLTQFQSMIGMVDCADERARWILQKRDDNLIELKPVFAWQVANYALFSKADYFLHMSATICGYVQYIDNLGIDDADVEIIEVPNSIPLQNRKVFALPVLKVSGNYNIQHLTDTIDMLIARNSPNNGIIHTVSFKLANDIKEHSKYAKQMIVSNDRNDILEFLSKPKSGRIVLSPSIEKGYDFKGDLSRFQILAKVPYGFLGDPLIKLNSEDRPDWYARKTILRLVQACGRSVRGVDDYANTYIIDSNFIRLFEQNRDIFPEWFIESVKIVTL